MSDSNRAVFLSYASQDSEAARRICDVFRCAGIEVWFDQSELRGGDAWDAKIRRQIRDCALFVPIISRSTQARREGYFRLEWRLAAERMQHMDDDLPFLVPVVIDATKDAEAFVPDRFRERQWIRIGPADSLDAFCERVGSLLGGSNGTRQRFAGSEKGETPARSATARTARPNRWWVTVAAAGFVVASLAFWRPWQSRSGDTDSPAATAPRAAEARQLVDRAMAVTEKLGYTRDDLAAAEEMAEREAKARTSSQSSTLQPPSHSERRTQNPDLSNSPQANSKSVAVLAFANLSDDKDNEYFSDGISEELLNVLAKVPGLKVSARTSAFSFKGKGVAIPEIAKQLGVAYVVEGSVRKVGNRVRITAQLIKAADGFHVWSENFDRELKDIFAVQDEIAGLIAQNLSLRLGAPARPARTVNPEAHRLVLEGRHYWNQRSVRTEDVLEKAASAFQRALVLDPQFAEAYAGLGDVWVTRGLYRSMDGRDQSAADDYALAKAEAGRALELNSLLGDPHVTLGYVAYCERRFAAAEQHFSRAFAANPNNALAHHWYALFLGSIGRLDQSLQAIERSLQLDPLSPNSLWSAIAYRWAAGRPAQALAAAERALELRPGVLPVHSDRAQMLLQLGRKEEAVAAAREVSRDASAELRWWADADAIHVLRVAGLPEEAAAYAERALERFSAGDYRRAWVLAAIGRGDEALQALTTIPPLALGRLTFNPIWDPWRNDPRLEAWLRRLGVWAEYQVARATLARMRQQTGGSP